MYTDVIRIQNSVNVNCLKEISKSMDYIKMQSKINDLKNAVIPLYNLKLYEVQPISECFSSLATVLQSNFSENLTQSISYLNCVLSNCSNILQRSILGSFEQWKKLSEKSLFLKIADELGFPIYLEMDTELQDRLIYSYRHNGNNCNKKEMCEIILDYYNDEYIDHILNGIKNVQVFNLERVVLIEEGIETYQLGLYGSSASLFAAQLSGMIRDVYDELSTFYRLSNREKKELLICYNQNCKTDSEKGMLLQIVNCQSQGFIIWHKVLQHFLNVVYSTKENDTDTQPNRNMICHGKQTNYHTKEMNLKLILCMDIITELAWRGVKEAREKYSEVIIDV